MNPRYIHTMVLILFYVGLFSFSQEQERHQENEKTTSGPGFLELRTTINPVQVRGSCEFTGIVQFVVEPEMLPDASPENPLYLRLELGKEAKLGETLVWSHPDNQANPSFSPIFLPITIDGSNGSGPNPLTADPESVAVARWKAGEKTIWLKIQSNGSTWINLPNPPRVRWTIGISARTTWEQANGDHTNMPASSRNPDVAMQSDAISTLICLDLQNSFLFPAPAPDRFSLLEYVSAMYEGDTQGVETAQSEDDIVLGTEIPFAIYGDHYIGRGYEFQCVASVATQPSQLSADLCPDQVEGSESGLIMLTSEVRELRPQCHSAWGVHQNSFFKLEVEEDASYGFRVLTDVGGQPMLSNEDPSQVLLDPQALVFTTVPFGEVRGSLAGLIQTPTGEYLSRDAVLPYLGESTREEIRIGFQATVWGRIGGPSQEIRLTQSFYAMDKDLEDALDIEPFAGPEQQRDCNPSYFRNELGEWAFGQFIACGFCDCENDFDCDYVIGEGDLQLMYNQFFTPGPVGDVDQNGQVDVLDALLLMQAYGSCLD